MTKSHCQIQSDLSVTWLLKRRGHKAPGGLGEEVELSTTVVSESVCLSFCVIFLLFLALAVLVFPAPLCAASTSTL